ncbi:MAG: hypothetical protein U0835_17055 [Isosphaeraceae bacterium]
MRLILKSPDPGDPRGLELGPDGRIDPAPVEVAFDKARISKGKPGRLKVLIRDPRRVRRAVGAGVYSGRLVLKIFHPKLPPKYPLNVPIPVEVRVHGQRLVRFDLLERPRGRPMAVGQPASVEVEVESVGTDLGKGELALSWREAGKNVDDALLRVPLPLETPSWDPTETRPNWACHPAWSGGVIVAPPPVTEDLPVPSPGLTRKRHRLRLLLPDLFALGEISGSVSWSSGDEAVRLPLAGPVPVGSGFWASQRLAYVGEPVRVVAVVSRKDCREAADLDALPVDRSAPGVTSSPAQLEKVEIAGTDHVLFAGEITPGVVGDYRIAVGNDAPDSVRLALARPLEVRAPFAGRSSLPADRRLVLFKGSPPLYWNFYFTSEDGADHKLRRSGAFVLDPDPKSLKRATVRLGGVFQNLGAPGKPGRRLDPARDPNVRFAEAGKDPEPNGKAEWSVDPGGSLRVDLVADVDTPPAGQPEFPDGTSEWVARWVVTADDAAGNQVARVVETPFALEVANEWSYYFTTLGAITLLSIVVILAAACGVLWLIIQGVFGRDGSKARPAPARAGGAEASPDDPFGGYTPPSPSPAGRGDGGPPRRA